MSDAPLRILDGISCPADLKGLTFEQLEQLAREIREEMVQTTSCTGGHLAPSLGVVELTIGIHRALDCPEDKLVFDVGHQAYVHKLLTGRASRFGTLRTYGGLSGFTKREESEYDMHDSGHASDSLSIALGLALARDARGGHEEIVAVIGDGSMTGGMAFEAMNYIGHVKTDITIVLNDNEMSISHNVGALAAYLGRIRLHPRYIQVRDTVEQRVGGAGRVGRFMMNAGDDFKESFKQFLFRRIATPGKYVTPGMFFEDLGIKYVGPIDGHNIQDVQTALERAKGYNGPVLLHFVTRKGEGYEPAACNPDAFHGVGAFDVETGVACSKGGPVSYTKAFSEALLAEAAADERIVAITAAMSTGTGLDAFAQQYPDRFYDVGIAEANAVGMAAGLALGGQVPVVAIYSTFLQRAFDQVIVNVALQGQHVVFCLDRAGVVGEDGPTHHGVFDIAYLRLIPNMTVLAPSNEAELSDALHTALSLDGPVALRYPRGSGEGVEIPSTRSVWERARSVSRREGTDVEILAVGRMVGVALEAAELLAADGVSAAVRDMRWIKPLDVEAVREASDSGRLIVTIEEGTQMGGFGSAVLEELARLDSEADALCLAIPDHFVVHGAMDLLLSELGLDPQGVHDSILSRMGRSPRDVSAGS